MTYRLNEDLKIDFIGGNFILSGFVRFGKVFNPTCLHKEGIGLFFEELHSEIYYVLIAHLRPPVRILTPPEKNSQTAFDSK